MIEPSERDLFRFFDPLADWDVVERALPHWMQDQTVTFITWRTWDSIPADAAERWRKERNQWLNQRNLELPASKRAAEFSSLLKTISPECRKQYYRLFSARWESWLDDCHGECQLRNPELSKIVADSLLFFDNARYLPTDFVVMPNHVHALVAFKNRQAILDQCKSWKHFTAKEINKRLLRKGHFWESDSFDHLVRSEEQWYWLRRYIRDNPIRAALKSGEYVHYSRELI